nr:hypothetical protein GCM10020185_77930 [Pseudomonas brassicacearum subsp. brassicacearum]
MLLKHKIVALGILPLVLAIAVICALVISLNRQLGDQQAQLIEDSILASKRAELKNYVEMAQSLIAPLYDNGRGDERAQQQVLEELRKLSFGINGYFFSCTTARAAASCMPASRNWWGNTSGT